MRVPRSTLLAVLLVLAAPLGAAEWRAAGGLEPDTGYDLAGNMFLEPDRDLGGQRVYFHGFEALPQTSVNPNLAATGSRIAPAPATHHRAILGVWKDCNGDGYIGMAESALQDYHVELLLGDPTCPPTPGATEPVHNDGQWVNELLTLGMVDPCERAPDATRELACPDVDAFANNERVIYSDDTYVWADLGAPGSTPAAECILAPPPRGTTTGTGATLGYLDCQGERGLARQVNALDADGSLGLRFDDPARPEESDSALNQRFPVTPFGTPMQPGLLSEETPSVTVWDCSEPKAVDARSPTGPTSVPVTDPSGGRLAAETFPWVIPYTITGVGFEDEDGDAATPGVLRVPVTDDEGTLVHAPAAEPSLHEPTWSAWAALVALEDGAAGDCDPETASTLDGASPQAALENEQASVQEARKDRPSFTFLFFDGHRGINPSVDEHLGATTPSDGGTSAFDHDRNGDGPMWSATVQAEQDPQLVSRKDLGPAPPRYVTYYAHLGVDVRDMGIAIPPAGERVYGAENCGANVDGIHRGWQCDPDLWWKDAQGGDAMPRYARGERIGRLPGDTYHVRDVDCYDGEVLRGLGVHASLQDTSGVPPCSTGV